MKKLQLTQREYPEDNSIEAQIRQQNIDAMRQAPVNIIRTDATKEINDLVAKSNENTLAKGIFAKTHLPDEWLEDEDIDNTGCA